MMKVYASLRTFDGEVSYGGYHRVEIPPDGGEIVFPECKSGSTYVDMFGIHLRPDVGKPVLTGSINLGYNGIWIGTTVRLSIHDGAELVRSIAEEVERLLDDEARRGWIPKGEPYR